MNTINFIDALKDGLIDEVNNLNKNYNEEEDAKCSTLQTLISILDDISTKIETPLVESSIR